MFKNQDFLAGLLFTLMGSAFGWAATSYRLGDSSRMGPGFFPLLLGVLLALLGSALMVRAMLRRPAPAEPGERMAYKPLVFVISANLVFGLALGGVPALGVPPLGLIVGVYLLTFAASFGAEGRHLKETSLLATALAALSYVAFVVLLKLQFPVWPAFAWP